MALIVFLWAGDQESLGLRSCAGNEVASRPVGGADGRGPRLGGPRPGFRRLRHSCSRDVLRTGRAHGDNGSEAAGGCHSRTRLLGNT